MNFLRFLELEELPIPDIFAKLLGGDVVTRMFSTHPYHGNKPKYF